MKRGALATKRAGDDRISMISKISSGSGNNVIVMIIEAIEVEVEEEVEIIVVVVVAVVVAVIVAVIVAVVVSS